MSQRKTHYFNHEAMASPWEFAISHHDESRAAGAARECFRQIDQLEETLSRFREHSDIGRLNTLGKNDPLAIQEAAMECLELAWAVWEESGGAFDVTIGPAFRLWVTPDGYPCTPDEEALEFASQSCGMDKLVLDPATGQAMFTADNMRIDLGGIGKGYALDQAASNLRQHWEIENALLNAGNSTILAMGDNGHDEGWLVNAGGDEDAPILLKDSAISASGFEVRGAHIIDPRTLRPVARKRERTWACATSAALSDALSTAFMVMNDDEIEELAAKYEDVRAMVV